MKKAFLTLALCFVMLLSLFAITVRADGDILRYYTFLEGADIAGTIEAKCFAQNTRGYPIQEYSVDEENGYLTVTPVPGQSWAEFCLTLDETADLSTIYDTGYLKLKMKSRVVPKAVWGCAEDKSNGGQRKYAFSGWAAETDTNENWCEIKADISTVIKQALHTSGGDRVAKLYICFEYSSTTTAPVDIAEISVYGPDNRPFAQFETSKMNSDGMYEVQFGFNRLIASETAYDGIFTIDGVTADSVSYDENTEVFALVFDMMPEFPSELTLSIDGGIKGANGLPVRPTAKLINSAAVENVAINLDKTTCLFTDSGLEFDTELKCIYDKTGQGQQVTMFVAVFSGNSLIASKASETQTLAHKSSEVFSVDIQDLTETADLRAEIYIIDTEENGRPLAKKAEFAKESN